MTHTRVDICVHRISSPTSNELRSLIIVHDQRRDVAHESGGLHRRGEEDVPVEIVLEV